ncbi:ATP-dependent DNA ligase [Microbacterium sp. SS28]|uniref:DUF7882 family protein n=1 Tax=Microbacterium sp. SS28 TaxID=2919948 RepID=UPI001FAB1B10|nr:ATP-dependent DNA ligase [Microbacterium sp. SS28]
MGRFIYEETTRVEFDDRALAHLQIVVGTKLRRNESFYFSWRGDLATGGGRTSVWVHAHAHLLFRFHGSRTPRLNRAWLDALMYTANSPNGLHLVPEPPDIPDADGALDPA